MKEKNVGKVTGFRLEVFNIFIIVFTVIVTVVLSFVVYMAHSTYEEFYDATKEYIACRTAAEDIHEASDYLTKQVRNFAYSGNLTSLKNYFKEANVDKRRQKALETIDSYLNEDVKNAFLESAVNYSFQLMNIEYHSMRLVLEANGVDMDLYPEEVLNYELTSAEKAMSNEEKIELAKVLVSSTTYDNYKDNIYNSVGTYTKELLSETEKRERENSALFSRYQQIQMILIIVLLCVLLINVAFTSTFLIRPLRRNSKLIVNKDLLPVKGPAEMRTFAVLYNKVLEKTKIQQEKLTYDASHDSLTGIQNRSIFDEMYHSIDTTAHISLALIDIDHFKSINDTHGHEIGDGVLKWLASIL
ncbi:MAG: GGDEF domain-containing protein, partial [Clostridia bacterium]|nr:GGDEF domain-containing protein [Clostridia bacterium]